VSWEPCATASIRATVALSVVFATPAEAVNVVTVAERPNVTVSGAERA
jgi:hypothetical protein